jgi:5'-phosphate synthase pdxT subunit
MTLDQTMRIGILELQGDFAAHARVLRELEAEVCGVRAPGDLEGLDGIILPGGESTTMLKLLHQGGLWEPLRDRLLAGLPALGTCAGLILLAQQVHGPEQESIGVLAVVVERNAYGRQRESFVAEAPIPALGPDPKPLVFIRAPKITETGDGVRTLASYEGDPILVAQGAILAAAFHPELTPEASVHRLFLGLAGGHSTIGGNKG